MNRLSDYLSLSQKNKIYMLIKDNTYHLEIPDINNYKITSYEKYSNKSLYIATINNNKKIKILLRWKNGNGIAFPAFQIS